MAERRIYFLLMVVCVLFCVRLVEIECSTTNIAGTSTSATTSASEGTTGTSDVPTETITPTESTPKEPCPRSSVFDVCPTGCYAFNTTPDNSTESNVTTTCLPCLAMFCDSCSSTGDQKPGGCDECCQDTSDSGHAEADTIPLGGIIGGVVGAVVLIVVVVVVIIFILRRRNRSESFESRPGIVKDSIGQPVASKDKEVSGPARAVSTVYSPDPTSKPPHTNPLATEITELDDLGVAPEPPSQPSIYIGMVPQASCIYDDPQARTSVDDQTQSYQGLQFNSELSEDTVYANTPPKPRSFSPTNTFNQGSPIEEEIYVNGPASPRRMTSASNSSRNRGNKAQAPVEEDCYLNPSATDTARSISRHSSQSKPMADKPNNLEEEDVYLNETSSNRSFYLNRGSAVDDNKVTNEHGYVEEDIYENTRPGQQEHQVYQNLKSM